eukprot:jgi/Ulvmu1/2585/UM014_0036.1
MTSNQLYRTAVRTLQQTKLKWSALGPKIRLICALTGFMAALFLATMLINLHQHQVPAVALESWSMDRTVTQSSSKRSTFTTVFQSISQRKPRDQADGCWRQDKKSMAGAPPCSDGLATDSGSSNASVALLFLVQEEIPTEPIWTAFIAAAAGLQRRQRVPPTQPDPPRLLPKIPEDPIEINSKCWRHGGPFNTFSSNPPRQPFTGPIPPPIANSTEWLRDSCHAGLSGQQLYAQQDLFTIYVHRRPDAAPAPPGSIFHGRDISDRVRASFAQASLVAAHRRLLTVSLQDPRNSMFLLVSETCIPLYHPAIIWAQMMAEAHISRVADGVYNSRRWSKKMETEALTAQRFQKSDQWVSLTRMHAEVAANDAHVWTMFKQFCKSQVACDTEHPNYGHTCVADEHYVATLLASYRMDESRDGIGEMTFVDWSSKDGPWHPRTFYPGNAPAAIRAMRARSAHAKCNVGFQETLASVKTVFNIRSVCDGPNEEPDDTTAEWPARRLSGVQEEGIVGAGVGEYAAAAEEIGLRSVGAERGLKVKRWKRKRKRQPVKQIQPGITETAIKEIGQSRENLHAWRGVEMQRHMQANLRASGWLGAYEPMRMNCPLFGRRVSGQAVSDFAAQAWRCDGLGFGASCLNQE